MAHFGEMPGDHHPGAAGGDAHDLVVIASAAAAGEGVAQPEIVIGRDAIGDVGEGGGALIGGDDDIGVITIAPDHGGGRQDGGAVEIIGDVQHALHQQAVAGDAFGQECLAIGGGGRVFQDEAALGAGGHDDDILQALRLHQAEDFGAEILTPVGPADAATCHWASAQVAALHPGGMDEDFPPGPGLGHIAGLQAFQLEGEIGFALVEIGPEHGVEHIAQSGQDAVLIGVGHAIEQGFPGGVDALFAGGVARQGWVEAGVEEVHQQARGLGVGAECGLDAALREGKTNLLGPAIHRPQQPAFAPIQLGAGDKAVEAIGIGFPGQQGGKAAEQFIEAGLSRAGPGLQGEDMQHHAAAIGEREVVRHLLDGAQVEAFEERQGIGQRQGAADIDQAQLHHPGITARWPQEGHGGAALGQRLLGQGEIGQGRAGGGALAIAGREGLGPECHGGSGLRLAARLQQGIGHPVLEAAGHFADQRFQRRSIDPGGVHRVGADDVVDAGQRRVAEGYVKRREAAAMGAGQQFGHLAAQAGVEILSRQPDDGGDETAKGVGAQHHGGARHQGEVQRAAGAVQDFGLAGLEQLIARPGVEDIAQRPAVMAVGGHARGLQHPLHLRSQHGDGARVAVIGGGGEEAEEEADAEHAAIFGKDPHRDHIGMLGAVDGAAHIRLGDGDGQPFQQPAAHGFRHGGEVAQRVEDRNGGVAQQAQPFLGTEARAVDHDAAMAEQDEIILGQPGEEGARVAVEPGLGAAQLGQHGGEILHRHADIGQGGGDQRLGLGGGGVGAGEADAHQAFAQRPLAHGLQAAIGGAGRGQHRVQHLAQRPAMMGEGAEHAIDQEGHVVGDDFGHRVGEAAGGEHADTRLAQQRLPGEAGERDDHGGEFIGRHGGQFGQRNTGEERAEQGLGGFHARRQGGGSEAKGLFAHGVRQGGGVVVWHDGPPEAALAGIIFQVVAA